MSSAEMRAAEAAALARGITAEALMDEAGAGVAETVRRFLPTPGRCIAFIGKGHNGGDAIVAAEHLRTHGWEVELRCAFEESAGAELTRKKRQAFDGGRGLSARIIGLKRLPGLATIWALRPLPPSTTAVLDGLLGLGAKPPLREPVRAACREINELRRSANARVFAVDLPSGLEGDCGEADPDCVVADCTVAIGFAKRGLLADRALDFVGRLEVIPLRALQVEAMPNHPFTSTAENLHQLLPRRHFGAYKNQFGRIGIVAGSEGLTGAAILCACGALRAGAGLVELFVPRTIYPIVAAAAPPEAMVKPIDSYRDLLQTEADVWAIGPGLGRTHADEIFELVEKLESPAVIDADALNIIAGDPDVLNRCAGPRLLTPHPGEMKRLFRQATDSREQTARDFCSRYGVALLLKGSRTIVSQRDESLSYNTTGTPAMATGGMGDVLTGVCAALIGQKLSPY
ncbi:MAG: NAD(P)H-hydrate dehydratase, partial [Verrucomicrobiota bacterium]|nr:NAD(P)H-hydrate dehydratase [Verrucomicrobiota bacterium]